MAKILCTISPKTQPLTGMDMVRINGAFGTPDEIREMVNAATVPVILDIPRGRKKPRPNPATDEELIELALQCGVSYLGISYVKEALDILSIREMVGKHDIKLIAKIEAKEVLDNLDAVIRASDGVMIDRGDLVSEISFSQLPRYQKKIITKCNLLGKTVIVATEMLMSMIESRTPTKAEILDIANAIADGADYVMVSEETAIGKHPQQVVDVMRSIIRELEGSTKVLILAAGAAPRLGSLTAEAPACLIDIGGELIIEHQINNLKSCGINEEDIIIATGKAEERVREVVRSSDIHYVHNPWFDTSNMMTTVWLARDLIRKGCIILYGDIIFDRRILRNLLKRNEDIVLSVEPKSAEQLDEEAEKVCVQDGKMILHPLYDSLPTPKHKCVPLDEAYGEFIGLSKFSHWGINYLINQMDQILKTGQFNAFLVYAFEQLVKKGIDIYIDDINDWPWQDNDTIHDLKITRNEIYPRIKLNEQKLDE